MEKVNIELLPPNKLAEAIGNGAVTMTHFLSKYGLQNNDYQKSFLECIGYLLAHLHLYASLSDNIISAVVEYYRFPQAHRELIYSSAEFYSMLNYNRLKAANKEEFWYISVLYQNILSPGTHRQDFFDWSKADFFMVTDFWVKLNPLLVSISETFVVKRND